MSVMQPAPDYRLGIIEGFFGPAWSWQARTAYAGFLADQGFNTYVYAPKQDARLRRQWHQPHPAAELDALVALARHYRAHRLCFGIGLSPFELYRDFNAQARAQLVDKLAQLNTCEPALLCILFDDMVGDLHDLAATQLAIVDCIVQHSNASAFAVCPTYYSDDPLLTRHFGAQPATYLDELGSGLDPAIDVFWTGPRVISSHYPPEHLAAVATRLRRKPLLWDNYPVNDAQRLVDFLHLAPFPGRDCNQLREHCAGHLANPMNQAFLSQLPLHGLAAQYRGNTASPEALFANACNTLCPPALARLLIEDAERFQHAGLARFTPAEKAALQARYHAHSHPMAAEIRQWLNDQFAFDPACLT